MALPMLFYDALEAMLFRFRDVAASDPYAFSFGIISRALNDFTRFINILADTPILGFGLGIGGNATTRLGMTGTSFSVEDDWSRNIVDLGPFFGLLFIAFRIALVVWLAKEAVVATRRSNNPLPLLLFGFIGIILLYGQITGQGTINGYGWLFAGFCMAANQLRTRGRVTKARVLKRSNRLAKTMERALDES